MIGYSDGARASWEPACIHQSLAQNFVTGLNICQAKTRAARGFSRISGPLSPVTRP